MGRGCTRQRPDACGLYLAVDEVDSPLPVIVEAGQAPPPPRRRGRMSWRMLAIWAGLMLAVIAGLFDDGHLGPDDWTVIALMCLAGWPVTVGICRVSSNADEASRFDGPAAQTARTHWVMIVMRRGAVVDTTLVKMLAELLGVQLVEL